MFMLHIVLVPYTCNKVPQTGWLTTVDIYCLIVLGF